MKEFVRKMFALAMVLALVTGVCALFSYRKSGFFIDEVYTYGLSNSYYKPFVIDLADGGIVDKVLTHADFEDYITVGDGERFAFGSVYYNQEQDVHPPLYYWLFHTVHSLFGGHSKWIALGLDYVLYMLALLVLWKLCMLLFDDRNIAAAGTVLYGLSGIGVSTMLMVRMYVLLTLLTVLLTYLAVKLMREQKKILYPLFALTLFAGLMTQYYFVFYAFFLCAVYDIRALLRRDFKDFVRFSLWAIAGVACLVLAFPACIDQLFADALVSGGSALDNLKATWAYGERFQKFWNGNQGVKLSAWGMRNSLEVSAALAVLLLPWFIKRLKGKALSTDALLPVLSAGLAYAVVVVISPVPEPRYIYNIMPLFVLPVCFVLHLISKTFEGARFERVVSFVLLLAASCWALWTVRTYPPDYLYPEHNDYNAAIEPYTNDACVYFNDNRKGAMTQDLIQLLSFDDVFVTDDPASEKLTEYLADKDSDNLVVYIDTSKFWSSGFEPEEILPVLEAETGYGNAEVLYQYELSETYLLTR